MSWMFDVQQFASGHQHVVPGKAGVGAWEVGSVRVGRQLLGCGGGCFPPCCCAALKCCWTATWPHASIDILNCAAVECKKLVAQASGYFCEWVCVCERVVSERFSVCVCVCVSGCTSALGKDNARQKHVFNA